MRKIPQEESLRGIDKLTGLPLTETDTILKCIIHNQNIPHAHPEYHYLVSRLDVYFSFLILKL